MKLGTKFECNRAIRGGVIAISMFELMTLNIALRVAFGSGIIFTKLDLRQLILAWIIAFFWYWYIMLSHDLDRGPLDLELLQNFGCPVIKLRTQFQRNRISYWRFRIFSPCNFSGGARLTNGSQGCVDPTSPNLARTQSDHFYTRVLFLRSVVSLHFQRGAAQNWVMSKSALEVYSRWGAIQIHVYITLTFTAFCKWSSVHLDVIWMRDRVRVFVVWVSIHSQDAQVQGVGAERDVHQM